MSREQNVSRAQTQPEQSNSALDELHALRVRWIDLSRRLPSDVDELVPLWSTADMAMFQMIAKLRARTPDCRS